MKRGIAAGALLAACVALAVAGADAQSGATANVEVRVWQRVSDAQALYISARPQGGSWRTLGTIPIAMSGLSQSGRYHYGDITVTVPRAGADAVVEVRVWQQVSDARALFISARPRGGSWSTLGTIPLDMSGLSSTGAYRYGDITVRVPLPATPTPEPTPTPTPTPRPTPTPSPTPAPTATPAPGARTFTCSELWDVHQRTEGPDEGTAGTTVGYRVWDALCDIRDQQRVTCTAFHGQLAVHRPAPTASGAHLFARWEERMLRGLECPAAGADGNGGGASFVAACDFADSAQKVVASTALVTTSSGSGSAFYVGNGEWVTAGHVVEDARNVTLRNARVNVTASVVGYFPGGSGDVAILRSSASALTPLEWAGAIAIGETVAFAGYPLGFGTSAAISRGVVSRLYTDDGVSFIQTDASVNPGNSGGPLFDECGRVAGVASWKIASGRDGSASEGLGFAVAEPSLNRLLSSIRAGGGERPATTGASSRGDSYLTITAFCTERSFEDLSADECGRRSRVLRTAHDRWNMWARGVVDFDDVVYRFNGGVNLRSGDVWDALLRLRSGCHELQAHESGVSTHWSAPYEFCFAR